MKCSDGEYIGLNFKPEKGVAYGIDQKTNMDKYIIHNDYDINGNRLDIIEIPSKKSIALKALLIFSQNIKI